MSFRTQRDLERLTLPNGKAEVFHFDARCPGLSVRIQRTGKPAFVVWYTAPNSKRKRLTLGPVAGVELDDARRQAAEIINAARGGRDPSMDRKQARQAAAEVFTVGDLISAYLTEHAQRHQRPRTLIETKRALNRHWLPLHTLPAVDVDRRDVSARLLELARTTGTVGANRARANLSAAFVWAMKAGLIDHNPVIGTVKGEETSRERVLAPDELGAIWEATADLNGYDAIVRLLMLTGARRLEVGGMAGAELDLARALWLLPAARTKNRREHEVPLSRQALAIIHEFPELPGRPYFFGPGGRTPFSGWSRSKKRLDDRIARQRAERRLGRPLEAGEEPKPEDRLKAWTLHDLRRSLVTYMADREELGIEPHIIEAVVGHASGHKDGVAGIYNRAAYREQKKGALQAWANWLEATVAGKRVASNVVALAG
jgi:integrase